MNLDEAIDRYTNNAEYERTHGSLHGCLEFRQLAEWLKDYKRLLEQQPCEDCISRQAVMDALCDECELFHKNGEQTCLTKCESYHFLATLPSVTLKPIECDDVISRKAVLDLVNSDWKYEGLETDVASLPPVTPQNHGKMLVCPSCGLDVHSDFKYCPKCGAKMQESEVQE